MAVVSVSNPGMWISAVVCGAVDGVVADDGGAVSGGGADAEDGAVAVVEKIPAVLCPDIVDEATDTRLSGLLLRRE